MSTGAVGVDDGGGDEDKQGFVGATGGGVIHIAEHNGLPVPDGDVVGY